MESKKVFFVAQLFVGVCIFTANAAWAFNFKKCVLFFFRYISHRENGGGPLGWGPLYNQPHIHLI